MDVIPHVITDYIYMFLVSDMIVVKGQGGSHGMETFKGRGKEWNRSCKLDSQKEESFNEDTVLSCSSNPC